MKDKKGKYLIRSNTQYATKVELKKVNKRIDNMSGFKKTIKSMSDMIDNCMVNQRILNNEIRSLHKRIDYMETRMRNALRHRFKVMEDDKKKR